MRDLKDKQLIHAADLQTSASQIQSTFSLPAAFEADPSRVERFTFRAPHVLADPSTAQTVRWLRDGQVAANTH